MDDRINVLSGQILGAAIAVHQELGPGLLESIYQRCLALELASRGLRVETEVPVAVRFKQQCIADDGFRLDLLVEETVVVELKSVQTLLDVHKKQLLTYLRLSGKPLGLLINFNVALLKNGIVRIAN